MSEKPTVAPTFETMLDKVRAHLCRLAKSVTRPLGRDNYSFQVVRRDRENGDIEYQIFADTKRGTQIAWVQSTKHDADFIAACLAQAPLFAELLEARAASAPATDGPTCSKCGVAILSQFARFCGRCEPRAAAVPPDQCYEVVNRQGCLCSCCDHGEGSDCACDCHSDGLCSYAGPVAMAREHPASSPPPSASVDAPHGPECTCAQRYSYRDALCPTHGLIAPSASGECERQDADVIQEPRIDPSIEREWLESGEYAALQRAESAESSLSALRSALTALVEDMEEIQRRTSPDGDMADAAVHALAIKSLASASSGDAGTGAEAGGPWIMDYTEALPHDFQPHKNGGTSCTRCHVEQTSAEAKWNDGKCSETASPKAGPA